MTFHEQLIITIIDKAAIGLLLFLAGVLANRLLEKLKSRYALENELKKQRASTRLQFMSQQLSQFYWPLYLRLQKDNVVWERILDKKQGHDELRRRVGEQIEAGYILPNHDEIVRLVESHIHLARGDDELLTALVRYMRHVAVYKALRASGSHDLDPIHLQEPWPAELFPLVEHRTKEIQKEFDDLVSEQSDA
jgi:hypothetical protein